MMIVFDHPPNYKEICEHLPGAAHQNVVFTYGDNLYVPGGQPIAPHLMHHELTHMKQQNTFEGGPKAWWTKFLNDSQFRAGEEAEAYGVQYKFIAATYNRQQRKQALHNLAKDFSGPIYGLPISKGEAKDAILTMAGL